MSDYKDAKEVIQAATGLLMGAVLRLIQSDPHQWSTRPCSTCLAITSIVGQPFGCDRYREEKQK